MTTTTAPSAIETKIAECETSLTELEASMTYTLADAIRDGSKVTEQAFGSWGTGETACALTAAYIAVKARHLI